MIRRTEWIERIAIAVAIGLAAVGQLGLIRTGSATRNSYEMLRSAQRLCLDELTPLRVVWFLVPVVGLGRRGEALRVARRGQCPRSRMEAASDGYP